jgi:TatD DNase family protein
MIDTHAHLDFETFDEDRKEILERAFGEGIEYIIVPGVEPKNLNKILDMTEKNDKVFCGIGIHPHYTSEAGENELRLVKANSVNKKTVAIGEIGLDYHYDYASPDLQKQLFRKQIRIAKDTGLPIIVHNREADDDVYNIIKEEQDGSLKGVMHCFSSDVNFLKKSLDLGFHISFTGNITFKKSKITDCVMEVPIDRLLLETDSPFMTPEPHRGKRNEPVFVKLIAEKIAQIKNRTIDEVISMTTANAKNLFKLIVIIISFLGAYNISLSQDNEYNKNSDSENVIYENPFEKKFGIGVVLGTNTIVETYHLTKNGGNIDVSYEGIFTYGGSLFYSPLDFCLLEATYIYSKNTKITQQLGLPPTIDHIFELSSNWIMNPYSRVNFYGTIGYTAVFSSILKENKTSSDINAGIGFFVNVPTKYGLFNLLAEWKLDIGINTVNTNYWRPPSSPIPAKRSVFSSIPRAGIVYYPNLSFLKKK